LKIALVSHLMGRMVVSSLLKIFVVRDNVDALFILGDVVSPTIVRDLSMINGLRVYGFNGLYDDTSVIKILKETGGFIDSHILNLDGLLVGAVSFSINSFIKKTRGMNIDLLLTYYPGYQYTCDASGLTIIDELYEMLKPSLMIYGRCRDKCCRDNICCPGDGSRGDVLLIELDERSVRRSSFINVYSIIDQDLSIEWL